ncbi:MAG: restriction endonuclease [Nitrososphaerota archaeon]|nr:restriction endonuclease [Nitrososphaerota archaeon]
MARVSTELWTAKNFYCASCGFGLSSYPPGTKVYDFYSQDCNEKFQLKSSASSFSGSILGSEYGTTIRSIMESVHPSLILLQYDRARWTVQNLSLIHRACITSSCIIPRRPLSATARRAGWQGCIISIASIPEIGRIPVVFKGRVRRKESVLSQWTRSEKLLQVEPERRGWLADVLSCVERLYSSFTIQNMYSFEAELSAKHPNNRNVRAKIRQQLQILRDMGLVEFVGPGVYRQFKRANESL